MIGTEVFSPKQREEIQSMIHITLRNKEKAQKESLASLKEYLKMIFEAVNKRFEEMLHYTDKRFEEQNRHYEDLKQEMNRRFEEILHYIEKRFEAQDKRFEEQNKRIEDMKQEMNRRFAEMLHYTDKRFEDQNKRFKQLFWIIGIGFSTITALCGAAAYYLSQLPNQLSQLLG